MELGIPLTDPPAPKSQSNNLNQQPHLTFFQDNRICCSFLGLLTIGGAYAAYYWCNVEVSSLYKIPLFAIVISTILIVPALAVNFYVTATYPSLSTLITEYQTPGPVLKPLINTASTQIRLVLNFVAFLGFVFVCCISNLSLFELVFEAHTAHVKQFNSTLKFLFWFLLLSLSGLGGWLSLTAGNDDKRSLTHWKKYYRFVENLDSELLPQIDQNVSKDGKKQFSHSSRYNDSQQQNPQQLNPQQLNQPHFTDYHEEPSSFSSLSLIPHHHHYKPVTEPYTITAQQPVMRKDNRIKAGITSFFFLSFALIIFILCLINVEHNEIDKTTHANFAPSSWYILLAFAFIPVLYHGFILITFPRFSTTFITTTMSLLKTSPHHQSISVNLAGSIANYGLDESSYAIDPRKMAALYSSTAFITLQSSNRETEPQPIQSSPIDKTNKDEEAILIPYKNPHVIILCIICQFLGSIIKFLLTTTAFYIATILIISKSDVPYYDTENYTVPIIFWSLVCFSGIIATFYSALAVRDDINSYRAYDRYFNDWLMLVNIPQNDKTDKFLFAQLSEEY